MEFTRQKVFQKNQQLENLLTTINSLLEPGEKSVLRKYKKPTLPLILIVGCPRSGSTLLMQYLAKTRMFAYPTNLLSRFFAAPYIGALIQQILTGPEYNFNNELLDFNGDFSFSSNLGKTQGALAPNEFWYFWRRFFHYGEIQYLNPVELQQVDSTTFVAELAALESVFAKPLAMKGLIINWNIPYIASLFDNVLFLHITREPLYNAQSLLKAREEFYGDRNAWYSFKPPEYKHLKNLNPFEQVAGQVFSTNQAIQNGLSQLNDSHWLPIRYEEFCSSPEQIFTRVMDKLSQQTDRLSPMPYTGAERFQPSNNLQLPPGDAQKIITAYEQFSGTTLAYD